MSWPKAMLKYLLYQKPKSIPSVYQSGIEDKLEEAAPQPSGSGGKEPGRKPEAKEHGKPTDGTGGKKPRKRVARQRNKTGSPVREKFVGKVAENQSIDEILQNKVKLVYDLEENRRVLAKIFRVPQNKDAVLRSLTIGTDPPVKALLVFIDGITNSQVQNLAVLQPLMLISGLFDRSMDEQPGANGGTAFYKDLFDRVKEALVPANQVSTADNYARIVDDVLNGNSALLIDGFNQAILLETKGWQYRSVGTPQVEAVIRGPQEGFTEQIRVNTSLIRKIIHLPSLVTEFIKVGGASPMQCAVMYLDDLANPDLVHEVKRRLESIQADYTQVTGLMEQLIEDAPFALVPQVLATERPDRVAANLLEGHVAIVVDGSPFVMVVPATFFSLMQSPEDAYVRWPFGSFARLIRYAGLFLALLLPAHYVAIVAYHQEFIPTDLLLAMTGSREKVPFPSIVEVLIMELSFELIREAGVRIPGTVGTTLGIVGALILGQAAVAANIVSPILIIVVAVTALGSFSIPNYTFSLSIRVLRFIYIFLASVLGLLGIMVGFFVHVGLMVSLKSFGVPFIAPAAPVTRKNQDYFMRGAEWQQEIRPDYLDPLKRRRQPRISRGWTGPAGRKGDSGPQ
ncbi:spore germination protein [Desulfallas sp. Bu1-1]|uniref:spore germination protein n=1 Tax=Desulfallas sp. Bu1-1 TaxID=2787620 RepID=UPI0018A04CAD|nr:spore germination protein [Desulfallas sp. Bu1-1]MBF7083752.1 spore germination protein [Desulfallas sp. Bu1-1]